MSEEDKTYDIGIIGAGIAGLTLANGLEDSNYSVVVCEKSAEIKEIGAGLTLWHNAMNAFQKIGIADQIYAIGRPFDKMTVRKASGDILKSYKIAEIDEEFGCRAVGVHRGELIETLVSNLDHTEILTSMEFSHLSEDEIVTAHFNNGKTVRARILIGADGINSKVRSSIIKEERVVEKRYSGYATWRGIAELEPEKFDEYSVYSGESWGNGQRFGTINLSDNRIYWFAVHNIDEVVLKELKIKSHDNNIPQNELVNLFDTWHFPIPDLIQKTISQTSDALLYNPIHDIEPFTQWWRGRTTIIGDAAHATTPNIGQGACMAIVDSVFLADLIIKHGLDNYYDIFQTFEEERTPITHYIVNQSNKIGRIGQTTNPILRIFRNIAVRLAPKSVLLRQLKKSLAPINHAIK